MSSARQKQVWSITQQRRHARECAERDALERGKAAAVREAIDAVRTGNADWSEVRRLILELWPSLAKRGPKRAKQAVEQKHAGSAGQRRRAAEGDLNNG